MRPVIVGAVSYDPKESAIWHREQAWLRVLFSMSYDVPKHRRRMDLEGLRAWLHGRTTGSGALAEAVQKLRYFEMDSP